MSFLQMLKSLFQSAPRYAPADCAARLRAGKALLVDVREPAEWAGGIAESAFLLPLSDLIGNRARWTEFLATANGREVLLYCASGGRSGMAARILVAEGVPAANTGGLVDWVEAGWTVAPPPSSRSKKR